MTEPLPPQLHRRADCRLCAGTDLELVLALTPTPPANAFVPPVERDIVDYTRQLARTNAVGSALFDRLQGRHGVPWLVELTCLLGHYGIVASILNAFEIAPSPEAEALPLAPPRKGP